ncbi:MAG: bifunctional glycosyltransferase family 2 protein/CDP-glycerol:glycerophosphate glycerophosphotransferase [Clostridiales bacterium]|nr:bifunctional glycosyltransferase family 2 protein/CDP-glycerol:glycerophosphate glycerophosphotransferase [Clostridiales bacterium]
MGECGYPYKFSVVMSVYKVEEYIREAVDSLLEQTIGFEKNVQLIMVDDGSPDNSGAICDEYQEKYPYNIIVIHKENGGLPSARNAGVPYAEGRYVNFFDPDDMLSKNTFSEVYKFFNNNDGQVDIVSIPLFYFESRTGGHILNYKFDKGNRVIDLSDEYEYKNIQLSVAASFIKLNVVRETTFDTQLALAEDAKGIAQMLFFKRKLGVVAKCKYLYRIRSNSNLSLVKNAATATTTYSILLNRFSLWIYDYYKQQLGYIPWFIQFAVLYDIQGKIKLPHFPKGLFSEEEKEEFFRLLYQVLVQTDDKVINGIPFIGSEYKHYLYTVKYGRQAEISVRCNGTALSFDNSCVCYLENLNTKLDFVVLDKGVLKIEGFTIIMGPVKSFEVFLQVNDRDIYKTTCVNRELDRYALDNVILNAKAFVGEIPIDKKINHYKIAVCCRLDNGMIVVKRNLNAGRFAPITELKNSYYYKNGYKLTANKSNLFLRKCSWLRHVKAELNFACELWKLKKPGSRRAIFVRLVYYLAKPFLRKNIWLISDRINKADDNGEAIFRYIAEKKDKYIKCFFCIAKDIPDFTRLKNYGKVINYGRWRYKFYMLLGATIVTSHYRSYEYAGTYQYYSDLLQNSKKVFLQHGVTLHDVSHWANKYVRNISVFISATKQEYTSLIKYDYYYNENQVKLTGFPRYDLIYSYPKKHITFMPTWRQYLVEPLKTDGANLLLKGFRESTYFLFCNSLINSTKLLIEATHLGYKICFMLHPSMASAIDLFERNESVIFFDLSKKYSEIFAESDLIITDYSSIAFDFVYMRKPLIYCQFDAEEFFANHYPKGYFDYERDGFGEVETTLEGTVDRIIEYMRNGCALKDKYRERIESTFQFNDRNNCERVYNEIRALEEKN